MYEFVMNEGPDPNRPKLVLKEAKDVQPAAAKPLAPWRRDHGCTTPSDYQRTETKSSSESADPHTSADSDGTADKPADDGGENLLEALRRQSTRSSFEEEDVEPAI